MWAMTKHQQLIREGRLDAHAHVLFLRLEEDTPWKVGDGMMKRFALWVIAAWGHEVGFSAPRRRRSSASCTALPSNTTPTWSWWSKPHRGP